MMIMKLGERGSFTVLDETHKCMNSFFSIDSFANHVVDTVGAGDALLAYATLSMLSKGSEVIASICGTMAAACECEMDGNIPVKPGDVLAKIDSIERLTTFNGG
jgi:sugar/nucleoside kinase (ribokinase family)